VSPSPAPVELSPSRIADVEGFAVRRALPQRLRRTVGAWCFVDHLGPVETPPGPAMAIGPHPHIGLHTVTWLFSGEVEHRDSLGSVQLIRPGQLNLMTAGRGIAHAEQALSGWHGTAHGAQIWVAQPETTRHGEPAFEHHRDLPVVSVGPAVVTVLVGALGDVVSPARSDSPLVGLDVVLSQGRAELPVDESFEHAVIVVQGEIALADAGEETTVRPGSLAYLAPGRAELALSAGAPARLLVLGGTPFGEELLMWWNFVARTHDEVDEAIADWQGGAPRFGPVASGLDRIAAPQPHWSTA
jgi:redox-sensitive bicupin YhaK (pirin superfamily)